MCRINGRARDINTVGSVTVNIMYTCTIMYGYNENNFLHTISMRKFPIKNNLNAIKHIQMGAQYEFMNCETSQPNVCAKHFVCRKHFDYKI